MADLANNFVESRVTVTAAEAGKVASSRPVPLPAQSGRKRKSSRLTGLTGRQYHVLRIVNSYGWVTPTMVGQIAVIHGIQWKSNLMYRLLASLFDQGFLLARRLDDGTKGVAYGISNLGLAYIRAHGDALLCDTNVEKDPASFIHFVNLNRAVLRLANEFPTKFWLSDFQVRSDNTAIGASGFAKDYDAVAEFLLPAGTVRVAFEYERWQQSRRRYEKVAAVVEAEKYMHQVLIFLDRTDWLESMMPFFRHLGSFVGFVDFRRYMSQGLDVYAKYWYGDQVYEAPLVKLLEHRCATQRPAYTPIHRLKFGF